MINYKKTFKEYHFGLINNMLLGSENVSFDSAVPL